MRRDGEPASLGRWAEADAELRSDEVDAYSSHGRGGTRFCGSVRPSLVLSDHLEDVQVRRADHICHIGQLLKFGGKDTLVSVFLSVCLSLSVDKMR